MPGTLGKRNAALADLAVPESSPGKLARVAAADAIARGPAPTSVEVDGKQCLHEVVWPGDWDGPAPTHPPQRKEGPAAREFSFKLDPFQQVAVNCLEEGGQNLAQLCLLTALHNALSAEPPQLQNRA